MRVARGRELAFSCGLGLPGSLPRHQAGPRMRGPSWADGLESHQSVYAVSWGEDRTQQPQFPELMLPRLLQRPCQALR